MTRSISSTEAPETRRINPFRFSATGSEGTSPSGRWRRKNATSRRTNSRISPSKAAAASCSISLVRSGDFRFGAYISGPGFSGTAPSRSGLMAVMINSYKAQSILRGVPSCRRIAARELGGRGAKHGTSPPSEGGRRVIHVFSGIFSPFSLPVHLKPGADALAAGDLAEIGQRGGNLEWAIELLLGAERIMVDRIATDTRQPRAERCPRRQDVEFDRPFVAEYLT